MLADEHEQGRQCVIGGRIQRLIQGRQLVDVPSQTGFECRAHRSNLLVLALRYVQRTYPPEITLDLVYPGNFMLMFSKLASQPSAKTPICAPSMECVIRQLSAFTPST